MQCMQTQLDQITPLLVKMLWLQLLQHLEHDAFGSGAMGSLTTGMDNVGIARQSFPNLTTGNGNVGTGNIGVINQLFNVTTESDRLLLGHVNIGNAYIKVALTVTSDERDKIDFDVVPYGLDFVNKLKHKSFWMRKDRDCRRKKWSTKIWICSSRYSCFRR